MKKARMNNSHFCFILFNLKIFGEIVTTNILWVYQLAYQPASRLLDSGYGYHTAQITIFIP